jgi:hypothetical protein
VSEKVTEREGSEDYRGAEGRVGDGEGYLDATHADVRQDGGDGRRERERGVIESRVGGLGEAVVPGESRIASESVSERDKRAREESKLAVEQSKDSEVEKTSGRCEDLSHISPSNRPYLSPSLTLCRLRLLFAPSRPSPSLSADSPIAFPLAAVNANQILEPSLPTPLRVLPS